MNTQAISVGGCNPQTIVIGRRGTYNTQEITFDLSYLIDTYGAGVAALMVMRSQDTAAYPAVVSQEDTTLTWTVSEIDTYYVGSGEVQLMWYVDGGLAKTVIFPMVVMRDILQTTEEPPDAYETWVDDLITLGAETLQNAQDAAQSASEAEQSATDAGAAKTAAENAQTAAETAQGLAEDAKTAAETAQGKAETAQGKAETAQEKAETAQTVAEAAADRAEDALEEFTTPTASATTLDPDDDATASYANGHFTFGIPKGDVGSTPDFSIGSVETLQPSQPATASITGTLENPVLNLGIPQGKQGDPATNLVQSVNGKTGSVVLDSGDIAYESTTVEDELGTINSALTSLQSVTEIIDTASGAIASFPDGSGLPIRSLVAEINPVQDLHGYDAPWPAGGGVNKLDPSQATNNQGSTLINGLSTEWNATEGYYRLYGTWSSSMTSGSFRAINVPSETRALNVKGFESSNHGSCRWQSGEDKIDIDLNNMVQNTAYDIKIYPIVYEGSTAPAAWSPYANLCPISGWTGLQGQRTGKNLFDQSQLLQATDWAFDSTTGYYYGKRSDYNIAFKNGFPNLPKFKENTQYTISVTGYNSSETSATYVRFYYTDGDYTTSISITGTTPQTVTGTSTNGKTVAYIVGTFGSEGATITYIKDFMLVEGSTASTYEEYQGEAISVSWQDEAGTVYGGTATYNGDGTWTLVDDKAYALLNNPDYWIAAVGTIDFVYTLQFQDRKLYDNSFEGLACSYMIVDANSYDNTARWNGATTYNFGIRSNNLTLDQIKADASAGKIAIVYDIAEPQAYTITTEQLLNTLYGINNIWVDVGSVSVEYPADTKLYIDGIGGTPDEDMIANDVIASGKYFMVNNRLFKSTASIAKGAQIIPNTNCTETNLVEALNALM